MCWQECVTPFGDKLLRTCDQRRSIRVASGGTVCIDVSSMGRLCEYQREMNWHCKLQTKYFCIHIEYSTYICVFCQRAWDNCLGAKAGLLGKSASSLALWLAERWHCEEDWCDSFVSYSNRVFHVFTSVFLAGSDCAWMHRRISTVSSYNIPSAIWVASNAQSWRWCWGQGSLCCQGWYGDRPLAAVTCQRGVANAPASIVLNWIIEIQMLLWTCGGQHFNIGNAAHGSFVWEARSPM